MIDALILCLACGFAALGALLGLRRTILLGMLAIPATLVGVFFGFSGAGSGTAGVLSPASLFCFLLSGGLAYLFLALLLRLEPDRNRVGFILKSILLRIPVTIAFAFASAVGVGLLLPRPGGAPAPALFFGLVIVIVVALHLFIGRLWKWRQSEPTWFRTAPGRMLGGMLGLGYSFLLLAALIPWSCSVSFELPATNLSFLNDDPANASPLTVEPPPRLVAAVVRSRLAWRFLNPADEWQALLLSARIPEFGVRIRTGDLPAARTPGYEMVRNGVWPYRPGPAAIPAHLSAGEPDCLVVRDSGGFAVLRLQDSVWVSDERIPFSNAYAQPGRGRTAWCVGDADDDGRDEIVAGDSNRLVVFQRQGTGLSRRVCSFRYQIDNVVVGDINNDGHNEIVLFASDEKLADGFERERVCITRLGGAGLELLWNDLPHLGFGDNRVTPSDELLAVADIENRRANQLLVYRPPAEGRLPLSTYVLLDWNGSQLKVARTFSVVNNALVSPKPAAARAGDGVGSHVVGPLAIGHVGDRTALIGVSFYGHTAQSPAQALFFVIDDGRLRPVGRLPSSAFQAEEPDLPGVARALGLDKTEVSSLLCWIDPDGKGPAVLRIAPWWKNPPRYMLDRVLPAQTESGKSAR